MSDEQLDPTRIYMRLDRFLHENLPEPWSVDIHGRIYRDYETCRGLFGLPQSESRVVGNVYSQSRRVCTHDDELAQVVKKLIPTGITIILTLEPS